MSETPTNMYGIGHHIVSLAYPAHTASSVAAHFPFSMLINDLAGCWFTVDSSACRKVTRCCFVHIQDIDSQENAGDVRNIPAGPTSPQEDVPLPARYTSLEQL